METTKMPISRGLDEETVKENNNKKVCCSGPTCVEYKKKLYFINTQIWMLDQQQPGEELMPKDASGKIILETADLRDTWEALEKYKDAGLTKSIGVSNFNSKQLGMILNKPGLKDKPVCNQCRWSPPLLSVC
ncbi:aldo-keto reductase family 1 member C15-like [Rhinolophus ferrumequinum]|uniref:aldo-keto reductase family 1 member C15-like n=1 Tax=Rhinolophus ferrumequinum TaxID=59479 RepID=UPI00140F56FB|nr:aldo-keto reductase family 1 member C15-like [Rhinolophus ferrumequinum]